MAASSVEGTHDDMKDIKTTSVDGRDHGKGITSDAATSAVCSLPSGH